MSESHRRPGKIPTPYDDWKPPLNSDSGLPDYWPMPPRSVVLKFEDIPHAHSLTLSQNGGRTLSKVSNRHISSLEKFPESLASLTSLFEQPREELCEAATFLMNASSATIFAQFKTKWKQFLFSLERAHLKTVRLSKHGAGRVWAQEERERQKVDPLLLYLRESRNEAEHGVEEVVLEGPASLSIGTPKGYSGAMADVVMGDGTIVVTHRMNSIPCVLTRRAWDVRVNSIVVRNHAKVKPPTMHMSKHIDSLDPIAFACLALNYHRDALLRSSRVN